MTDFDFALGETADMIRDSSRRFANDRIAPLAARIDADDWFPRALWPEMGELGLHGITVEEADGGLGLGHVEAGIVLEEIGRNLTPSPFLSTAVGAVTALKGASEPLRRRHLPAILAGESIAAIAIDEAARHRPHHVGLRAERSGNGFRLSGTKRFVPFGHVADLLIVAARTSGAQLQIIAGALPGMVLLRP